MACPVKDEKVIQQRPRELALRQLELGPAAEPAPYVTTEEWASQHAVPQVRLHPEHRGASAPPVTQLRSDIADVRCKPDALTRTCKSSHRKPPSDASPSKPMGTPGWRPLQAPIAEAPR